MIRWISYLQKYKKHIRKHKKKKEKTRKTIYYLNSEKIMKTFFIIIKKMVFDNTKNIK